MKVFRATKENGARRCCQAAELVNSSDEQLQRLNDVYRNTGETSMNAMKEGYQLGKMVLMRK